MKRIASLVFLVIGVCICSWAQDNSASKEPALGDVARQNRTQKPPAARKVWTDEDFPTSAAPAASTPAANDATSASSGENASEDQGEKKEDPVEKQKQMDAEWSGKIGQEKARLADMERELGLLEREYRLKAATYYADAGNRLRDPKGWADTEQQFQDRNKELKQSIADTKAKIEELQDEARKAGVSSGARE